MIWNEINLRSNARGATMSKIYDWKTGDALQANTIKSLFCFFVTMGAMLCVWISDRKLSRQDFIIISTKSDFSAHKLLRFISVQQKELCMNIKLHKMMMCYLNQEIQFESNQGTRRQTCCMLQVVGLFSLELYLCLNWTFRAQRKRYSKHAST